MALPVSGSPGKSVVGFILQQIKKLCSPLVRLLYLEVRFFSTPVDHGQLTLAYVGMHDIRAMCWGWRVCGPEAINTAGKRIWLWNLESYLARHKPDCQLVMVETCALTELMLCMKRGFKLSMWTQLALDSSKSFKELQKRSYRLEGEIPRLIRKNNLALEVSNNIDELDDFIEHMHRPFIKGRHGDIAFHSSRETIHKYFGRSDMLYVTKNGERIAGVLLEDRNGLGTLCFSGVKDNDPEHFRSGVVGCFYYFGLQRAIEKGLHPFSFGGTSPFLTDPLTYFKLSFKPYVMDNTHLDNNFIKVIPRRNDEALVNFLKSHPFLSTVAKGRFQRHVFISEAEMDSVQQFDEAFKRIPCGNLEQTVVHVEGDVQRIIALAATSKLDRSSFAYEPWATNRFPR